MKGGDGQSAGLRSEGKLPFTMGGGKRKSLAARRSRSASRSRRARMAGSSHKVKKGGMGFGAVIKEALIPFGIFALQKRTHRRRHNKKAAKKSRKTRRR
jgi:hypothetical protein